MGDIHIQDNRGESESFLPSRGTRLSRNMSQVLRHGAKDLGLNILPGGWVYLVELLALNRFKNVQVRDVRSMVANCPKKRFELDEHPADGLRIRACQGHSINGIDDESLLERLTLRNAPPVTIHGTSDRAWCKIRTSGLSKMGRNHVHMATGLPNQIHVVSGLRESSTVLIYVDVLRAITDGIKFWRAANGVVLTRGVQDMGILPPKYFAKNQVRSPAGNDFNEVLDG
jgi:RNA:NAD 2'-phosphotransferase (TPT1/KptA family)